MKTYLFTTTATMKEYNRAKFWIDSDILRPYRTQANDLKTAFNNYIEHASARSGAEISDHAIKTKAPIYIDGENGETIQTGYCITAKSYFENDNYKLTEQYIDLWVDIETINNPFIED